jgi:hypothetical protein
MYENRPQGSKLTHMSADLHNVFGRNGAGGGGGSGLLGDTVAAVLSSSPCLTPAAATTSTGIPVAEGDDRFQESIYESLFWPYSFPHILCVMKFR